MVSTKFTHTEIAFYFLSTLNSIYILFRVSLQINYFLYNITSKMKKNCNTRARAIYYLLDREVDRTNIKYIRTLVRGKKGDVNLKGCKILFLGMRYRKMV